LLVNYYYSAYEIDLLRTDAKWYKTNSGTGECLLLPP
jgi:hypothetical protein